MSYLSRYQQGEYEQVWTELIGLGARIREPGLIADATAVAHETMTRVAANVSILSQRLHDLDYEFFWPDGGHYPPSLEIHAQLAEMEAQIGVLPLSLHAWYEIVGSVDFRGLFPPPLMQAIFAELGSRNALVGKMGESKGYLGNPDRFYCYSDALVVFSLDILRHEWQPGQHGANVNIDDANLINGMAWWEQPNVPIAPQFVMKAGFSGGEPYRLLVPDDAVDGQLLNLPACYREPPPWGTNMWFVYPAPPMYFVEYLRLCCRWGGFPGFAAGYSAPPPLLIDLASDLLLF